MSRYPHSPKDSAFVDPLLGLSGTPSTARHLCSEPPARHSFGDWVYLAWVGLFLAMTSESANDLQVSRQQTRESLQTEKEKTGILENIKKDLDLKRDGERVLSHFLNESIKNLTETITQNIVHISEVLKKNNS